MPRSDGNRRDGFRNVATASRRRPASCSRSGCQRTRPTPPSIDSLATPRGIRTVLSKETDPVWVRPDWAYVEVARDNGLRIDSVSVRRPRPLTVSAMGDRHVKIVKLCTWSVAPVIVITATLAHAQPAPTMRPSWRR